MKKTIKKLNKAIYILLSSILLTGCVSEPTYINMEGTENNIEFKEFIDICKTPIYLVYDPLTDIVYIKSYTYNANYVYTPYYAVNGLPYLYNVETNT